MKKFDIKVENSSDYWSDFEGESCVYGFFRWSNSNSLSFPFDKIVSFTWDYIILSQKFGISIPVKSFENIFHFEREYFQFKNKLEDNREHNPLLFIQTLNDLWLFPTVLFTNSIKKPEKIVCIDPFLNLNEVDKYISQSSSMPLKVALDIGSKEVKLYYYLDNDIFNSWIDNKKTKRDPEIGGRGCWVDNSDLAYLNTPRLNSFLRDLKKLCFEYGANEFEFENLGLNDFSEDGVMFNGEVVYYEDIVHLLEPHHRIVK